MKVYGVEVKVLSRDWSLVDEFGNGRLAIFATSKAANKLCKEQKELYLEGRFLTRAARATVKKARMVFRVRAYDLHHFWHHGARQYHDIVIQ